MSGQVSVRPLPRSLPLGAGFLVAVALAGTAAVRATGMGAPPDETPVAAVRSLAFVDSPDGSVQVLDHHSRRLLGQAAPGSQAFLRSTMRGLARERLRRGIGAQPPFVLARLTDGRLRLDDPATGRRIELNAFGSTNAGVFAALLDDAAASAGHRQP